MILLMTLSELCSKKFHDCPFSLFYMDMVIDNLFNAWFVMAFLAGFCTPKESFIVT